MARRREQTQPDGSRGDDGAPGRLLTACSTCSAGVSVVCMGSMGAAVAATGASSAAGMAAMAGSTGGAAPLASRFLSSIGLGALNHVPDAVLHPIFIALLVLSVGSAMLAYRSSRALPALVLTLASAATLYVAIYVVMSEPLYYVGLGGMVAAAVAAFITSRHRFARARRGWRRAQPADGGGR